MFWEESMNVPFRCIGKTPNTIFSECIAIWLSYSKKLKAFLREHYKNANQHIHTCFKMEHESGLLLMLPLLTLFHGTATAIESETDKYKLCSQSVATYILCITRIIHQHVNRFTQTCYLRMRSQQHFVSVHLAATHIAIFMVQRV